MSIQREAFTQTLDCWSIKLQKQPEQKNKTKQNKNKATVKSTNQNKTITQQAKTK